MALWEWPIQLRSDNSLRMPAAPGEVRESVALEPTGLTHRHLGSLDAKSLGCCFCGPQPSNPSRRVVYQCLLRGSTTNARSRRWVRRVIKSQGQCRPDSLVWRCSVRRAAEPIESACRNRIRSPFRLRHIGLQPMARWEPEAARAAGTRAFTSSMSRSTESPCFCRR